MIMTYTHSPICPEHGSPYHQAKKKKKQLKNINKNTRILMKSINFKEQIIGKHKRKIINMAIVTNHT